MASFDLIEKPWIRCMSTSGEVRTLGLRDTIARAHELRDLANESPLVDAALFRLLLAVVYRVAGPRDDSEWTEQRDRGTFEPARFDQYLNEWRESFDLFHPDRPFYQIAGLINQSSTYQKGRKPARELIAEQSSYGAPRELFESRPSSFDAGLSPEQSARWLVAIQAFHPGGLLTRDVKNGDPTAAKSGLLCNSAVVRVQSDTLFDSLLLNLVNYPGGVFPTTKEDAPAWEQVPQPKSSKRACRGLLDWLTWPARRIQLLLDEHDQVGEFLLLNGVEMTGAEGLRDPMCGYRLDPKRGPLVVGLSASRAVWRDSSSFYPTFEEKGLRCPSTIDALADRDVALADQMFLRVEGQVPKKASILLVRSENMPLPRAFLQEPKYARAVREELQRSGECHRALYGALYSAFLHTLSVGDRKPDGGDISNLIETSQASLRFWSTLKPLFDRFVRELPDDTEFAQKAFQRGMRNVAIAEYNRASRSAATPSRVLKGSTLGERTLYVGLKKCGLSKEVENQESEEILS